MEGDGGLVLGDGSGDVKEILNKFWSQRRQDLLMVYGTGAKELKSNSKFFSPSNWVDGISIY